MTLPITLMTYVARRFAAMALLMLLALSALVALFDLIELLRRAATRPEANFALVAQIAALRVPYVAMQILPFAVLLGGIIAFWRLTRFSELVVARAAGISAWGFLAGPVLVALLLGLGPARHFRRYLPPCWRVPSGLISFTFAMWAASRHWLAAGCGCAKPMRGCNPRVLPLFPAGPWPRGNYAPARRCALPR
jgi:hypothetical protein